MLVRDLMTPAPILAEPSTPIRAVMEDMHSYKIRHVPVVDAGLAVGMISDRDIIFLHGVLDLYAEMDQEFIDEILELPVERLLKMRFVVEQDVVTVPESADLATAIRLLLNNKISALPVTADGSRKVVGILSYVDILDELLGLLPPHP